MADIDEKLAERIRQVLKGRRGIEEKRMFGGRCFLVHGNMICGTSSEGRLVVRVGPDNHDRVVEQKHVTVMEMKGRPMRGLIFVSPEGVKRKDSLEKWVGLGFEVAKSLPKK